MCIIGRTAARLVRRREWFWFVAVSGLAFLPVAAAQEAGDPPTIVRVEEDWRLEVRVPDPDANAPQISSVFAPTADVDFGYAEFAINHHSHPDYIPGGLQLLVWCGGEPIVVNNDPDGGILNQPNETITWTQSLAFGDDGVLTFGVGNGQSQTWGAFGNDGRLQIRTVAQLANLNGYSTDVSVANSGVGFASNRVTVLKITAVRRYASDGRVFEDSEDRVVFEHQ
jgi:hypothetical protein